MNREIKFKAWHLDEEEFVDVKAVDFEKGVIFTYIDFWYSKDDCLIEGNGNTLAFEEIELLQFTGLKDMNGVDIYEGDFIKNLDGVIAIVRFENGVFGYDRKITADLRTNEYYVIHQPLVNYVRDGCEVAGNEYENENLLEEK